jgi:hypothetical protein
VDTDSEAGIHVARTRAGYSMRMNNRPRGHGRIEWI